MPLPQRALPADRVAPPAPPVSDEGTWVPLNGSPVHALQAAIGEAWDVAPGRPVKRICAGKLALIFALGLAAWVPVVAAVTFVLA